MKWRSFKLTVFLIHLILVFYNFSISKKTHEAHCSLNSVEYDCPWNWDLDCQGAFSISKKTGTSEDSKICPWSLSTDFISFISLVLTYLSSPSILATLTDGKYIACTAFLVGLSLIHLPWSFTLMLRDIIIGYKHYNDNVEGDYTYKPPTFFVIQLFLVAYWFGMSVWVMRVVVRMSDRELTFLRRILRVEEFDFDDDEDVQLCPKFCLRRSEKQPNVLVIPRQHRFDSLDTTQATLQGQSSNDISVSNINVIVVDNMRASTGNLGLIANNVEVGLGNQDLRGLSVDDIRVTVDEIGVGDLNETGRFGI